MIKLNYSVRPYIKGSTGQVAIRVRWNQCKSEVVFFTNVWAEPDKWDPDLLKAKRGTTHCVRDMKFTYMEINEWKSRARLTPEGKATVPPENLLFLTPLKS